MKQYEVWFKKWWLFCYEQKHDPWGYKFNIFISFINKELTNNKSYSSINTCRSALSFVLPVNKADETLIKRFFRGIYNQRPPRPKYDTTWDPYPVLCFLEKMFPHTNLNLEQLSQKVVTLLALISAHRVQTFAKIMLHNIHNYDDRIEIIIPDFIKTSGKNKFQPLLKLPFFKERPGLCIASTILHYIDKTSDLRRTDEKNLIITHKKPHHPATSQTISRWIRSTLKAAGIDTNKYSSYSTRHAATSAAYRAGTNIEEIRKRAGWTQTSQVFNIFYNKPITSPSDCFAKGVLRGSNIAI